MRTALVAAFLSVALALLPAASGHTEGGGAHATGTFTLAPFNTPGYYREATLAEMNLSAAAGAVLQWNWSVLDGRSAVYFDIHSHPASGEAVRHRFTTAAADAGSWTIPGTATYYVFWTNPTNATVDVEYTFELLPAAPDATPFWLVPLLAVGGAVAVVAVASRGRRRKPTAGPEPGDDGPD